MGYFRESKLLDKVNSLQEEYIKVGTTPARKVVIEQHIAQLQRDISRLGITEEDKITEKKT